MKKLIPLIPLFEGKDLYVLIVTISKIMKGRDDSKILYYETKPNYFEDLIKMAIDDPSQKHIVLSAVLLLKEILILF